MKENLAKTLADTELEWAKCAEAEKYSLWDEQVDLWSRAKLVGDDVAERAQLNAAFRAKTEEANDASASLAVEEANDASASLEVEEAIVTKTKAEAQNIQGHLNDAHNAVRKMNEKIDNLVIQTCCIKLQAYFELLPRTSPGMELLRTSQPCARCRRFLLSSHLYNV
jgi:hypothetical protein